MFITLGTHVNEAPCNIKVIEWPSYCPWFIDLDIENRETKNMWLNTDPGYKQGSCLQPCNLTFFFRKCEYKLPKIRILKSNQVICKLLFLDDIILWVSCLRKTQYNKSPNLRTMTKIVFDILEGVNNGQVYK